MQVGTAQDDVSVAVTDKDALSRDGACKGPSGKSNTQLSSSPPPVDSVLSEATQDEASIAVTNKDALSTDGTCKGHIGTSSTQLSPSPPPLHPVLCEAPQEL